jgi:uncharacterized membrane protein
MKTKVNFLGHPIHPMLVDFPIVFYTTALVCYIVYHFNPDVFWFKVAVISNIAGVVMAAAAALPGFIDWAFIPAGTGAKKTGVQHMICNVISLILFAIAALIEYGKWHETNPSVRNAVILTAIGYVFTAVAGYLGFNLIQEHHVGIDHNVKS